MINDEMLVDFDYCLECAHLTIQTTKFPCDMCSTTRTNQNTRKPVYFREERGDSNDRKRKNSTV